MLAITQRRKPKNLETDFFGLNVFNTVCLIITDIGQQTSSNIGIQLDVVNSKINPRHSSYTLGRFHFELRDGLIYMHSTIRPNVHSNALSRIAHKHKTTIKTITVL